MKVKILSFLGVVSVSAIIAVHVAAPADSAQLKIGCADNPGYQVTSPSTKRAVPIAGRATVKVHVSMCDGATSKFNLLVLLYAPGVDRFYRVTYLVMFNGKLSIPVTKIGDKADRVGSRYVIYVRRLSDRCTLAVWNKKPDQTGGVYLGVRPKACTAKEWSTGVSKITLVKTRP